RRGVPFALPARPRGWGYFFSNSPSTWVLKISGTLSPFRSSSLAASPFAVHLKLNWTPTGNFSPTAFLISSFPSCPVTLALTSPFFSTVYAHTTAINLSALSPCRKNFMTSLSANSIFSSDSFLTQAPDKATLSPFLSPAVAARVARARTPQASTSPYLRVFGTMTFDPPSGVTATVGGTAAAEPAANPTAAWAEGRD